MKKYFITIALIFFLQSFAFSEEVNLNELDKQLYPFHVIDFNASNELTALVEKTIEKEFSPDFKITKINYFKLEKNFDPNPEIYLPELYDINFSFDDKNISNQVLVQVWFESRTLSKFGLNYFGFVSYKIDKEKIISFNDNITTDQSIGSNLTLENAKKLIEKLENNFQVKEFLSQFPDAKQAEPFVGEYSIKMVALNEKYYIIYLPFSNSISNYALPESFKESFPEIKEISNEIKRKGCKIAEGATIYFDNEKEYEHRTITQTEIQFDIEKGCTGNSDSTLDTDSTYRIIKKTPARVIGEIIFGMVAGVLTLVGFVLNLFGYYN